MNLFRSLFRGFRAFRIGKIAKDFALLDRFQNFAEFSHDLDPKHTFPSCTRTAGVRQKAAVATALARPPHASD
jgi:hypothetical protein